MTGEHIGLIVVVLFCIGFWYLTFSTLFQILVRNLPKKPVFYTHLHEIGKARSAWKRKDFEFVEHWLDSSGSSSTSADERMARVEALVFEDRADKLSAAWVKNKPASASAALVRMNVLRKLAWEARGRTKSEKVSKNGWEKFFDLIGQAYEEGERSRTLVDADLTSIETSLITILMGLDADRDTIDGAFDAVVSKAPAHWEAHHRSLIVRCRKWFGSHDEMFSFARERIGQMPKGHVISSLIASAHYEYYLYLLLWESKEKEADRYLRQEPVITECEKAFVSMLSNGETLRHPFFPHAMARFAIVAKYMENDWLAAAALKAMGPSVGANTWDGAVSLGIVEALRKKHKLGSIRKASNDVSRFAEILESWKIKSQS